MTQADTISLWLDSYDDLFSDFDPRHLSERTLSADFLAALRQACAEKLPGHVHLILMLPAEVRKRPLEAIIRDRLKSHVERHLELLRQERRRLRLRGLAQGGAGLAIMLSIVALTAQPAGPAYRALSLLAEAAGWFFFWSGMDQLLYTAGAKKPELEFYQKMSGMNIEFRSTPPADA